MSQRIYNLKRDVLDGSEKHFTSAHCLFLVEQLPSEYDIRKAYPDVIPPILNQMSLGSCGPNEISFCLRYCIGRETGSKSEWQPSRLYIYYFTRLLQGSPLDQDTGISIGSGVESISKYGACSETNWPYIISKFTQTPSITSIRAAHLHISNYQYLRVAQNISTIKQALLTGYPVIIGIIVYESFETDNVAKTGIVPMPDTSKEKSLGGHCVAIWGYSDTSKRFTLSNSWGSNWGQQGFFTLPYDYVLNNNLAFDFWTIKYFK